MPLWQTIVWGAKGSTPPHLEHHKRIFSDMQSKPQGYDTGEYKFWMKMFGPKFNDTHNKTMLFEEPW